MPAARRPRRMVRLHRVNAALLGSFMLLHFANHLAALGGPGAHMAVMDAIRPLYANALVEPLLFASVAVQIVSGLAQAASAARRGLGPDPWAWAQTISGAYVAFFLLQHMFALARVRWAFPGLDTNVWWAASVLSQPPFIWYFFPYYALGPLAAGVHVGAALRFALRDAGRPEAGRRTGLSLAAAGAAVGLLATLALAGAFQPFALPPAYQDYLDAFGL